MQIWGKLIGAVLGLVISGDAVGALIGLLVGHGFDHFWAQRARARPRAARRRPRRRGAAARRHEREESFPIFADPAETRRIAFATAVIVLGAKLAKADGRVTRDEIRAFKRVFPIDDDEVGDVARIYNQAKVSARGYEPYARQIAALFGHDPVLLGEVLIGLFEVARVDREIGPAEVEFLRRVAAIFGFDQATFERLHARYAATARDLSGADDAYAVLGLSRRANDEEIRQTYRKLVREHHPDRLIAKGMPPEMIEHANRTLATINAAYDRIAKERNLR
ncbi:MAG TPA: TerB family tellurite resistance protein [Geminicoccaceae bacterium]|nr:TerB family tellurite resistance protein [Geminicoccaceae bacterium]